EAAACRSGMGTPRSLERAAALAVRPHRSGDLTDGLAVPDPRLAAAVSPPAKGPGGNAVRLRFPADLPPARPILVGSVAAGVGRAPLAILHYRLDCELCSDRGVSRRALRLALGKGRAGGRGPALAGQLRVVGRAGARHSRDCVHGFQWGVGAARRGRRGGGGAPLSADTGRTGAAADQMGGGWLLRHGCRAGRHHRQTSLCTLGGGTRGLCRPADAVYDGGPRAAGGAADLAAALPAL